jgi:hypothetical protein
MTKIEAEEFLTNFLWYAKTRKASSLSILEVWRWTLRVVYMQVRLCHEAEPRLNIIGQRTEVQFMRDTLVA